MKQEMGERPPFVWDRPKYLAPTLREMNGIPAHADIPADGVLRTGHTLRPVSHNHGGQSIYYRLERKDSAPTMPFVEEPKSSRLGQAFVTFALNHLFINRTRVTSEVVLDRASR